MMFNLGVSVYSVLGHDIDQLLVFSVNNEFKAIELWDTTLLNMSKTQANVIKNSNISVSIHAPPINFGKVNLIETNTKLLKKSISSLL